MSGLRPTGVVDTATLRRLRAPGRSEPPIGASASSPGLETPPPVSAGWHGRPTRAPGADSEGAIAHPTGHWAGLAVRAGAGYRSPGGSRRVREIQRMLRRLGYRSGPVDGLFGPRTRASVQWFQVKHGLHPSGNVTWATLGQLRAGTTGKAQPAPKRAKTPAAPGKSGDAGERSGALSTALLVLLGVLAAAGLSLLAMTSTPRGRRQAAGPGPPRSSRVVGYASAQDQAELERQAAAIERGCRERGWTLACVIRENGSTKGNGRKRPGLAHAVKQVREGLAGRLVVDSLAHLGRSEDEIREQLERVAGNEIDLVALDAGGNGTPQRNRRRRARA